MGTIVIRDLHKNFGSVDVLRGISLDIAEGEFLSLLGPSGCGKSTLLRIIAGLERQSAGNIEIAGRIVDSLPAKARDIAMVFQSYALYPHMTVAENMSVPLQMRRLSALQRLPWIGQTLPGTRDIALGITRDVAAVARSLDIEHLLARKPWQLSGGQKQRVALGRAMVRQPAAFLLDEPLSNLDAKLRVQMRAELAELHRRLGVTMVYVTHDQAEAMTMSDRVAVMGTGEILQLGTPQSIYDDPNHLAVAEFVGSPKINVLPATVATAGMVDCLGVRLALPAAGSIGDRLHLAIRPEALRLGIAGQTQVLRGRIRLIENLGPDSLLHIAVAGVATPLVMRVEPQKATVLMPDREVSVQIPEAQAMLFAEDGRRLRVTASEPLAATGGQ